MRRIVILGNSGTGKSTLADRLGRKLNLPVIHLDALCWEPGWKRLPHDVFRARIAEAISGDAWITDGNFSDLTFDLRLPRADTILWVEQPFGISLWRVFRRTLGNHFHDAESLAPGCHSRFDARFLDTLRFMANFDRINRRRIETLRQTHGPHVPIVPLRGDREITDFLARTTGN
jgi:adenylate kinase family enzyme